MTAQHDGDLRDKHVGELIARLGTETSTLVRQELALARAELTERMELVRVEVADAVALARAETAQKLDQAKADVSEKGRKAGIGLGLFGVAGVASLLALGALTACLVLLLDRWLATDVAALVAALAWALVAAAAALRGRDRVHEAGGLDASRYVPRQTIANVKDDLRKAGEVDRLLPRQTIETVKEDVEWATTRRPSAAR